MLTEVLKLDEPDKLSDTTLVPPKETVLEVLEVVDDPRDCVSEVEILVPSDITRVVVGALEDVESKEL